MKTKLTAFAILLLLFSSCQNAPEQTITEDDTNPTQKDVEIRDFTTSYQEKEVLPSSLKFKEEESPKAIEKPQKPKSSSVAALLETFKKPSQKFSANPKKEFTITGNQGTEISFPANGLVLENGKALSGDVQIILEEYYTTSDMISAQLSTITKDKLLETGGMINLTVNSKGQPCKIKEGMDVKIKFASTDMKDMQLFDGTRDESGNMVWAAQARESESITVDVNMEEVMSKEQLLFLNNLVRKFERTVPYPKTAGDNGAQGQVIVEFIINKDGDIITPRIIKSPHKTLSKAVVYALENYPRFDRQDYDYLPINRPITLPVNFQFEKGQDLTSVYPDLATEKKIAETTIVMSPKDSVAGGGYGNMLGAPVLSATPRNPYSTNLFSSSSLGWINCDRFNKERNVENIYVTNPEKEEEIVYYLVFENIKAVMPATVFSEKTVFMRVPVGSKVTLVAVTMDGFELMAAFKDLKVSNKTKDISDIEFEKISKEEFARKLEKIDDKSISMR